MMRLIAVLISNLAPGEYTARSSSPNTEVLRSLPVAGKVKLRAGAREEVHIGSVAQ